MEKISSPPERLIEAKIPIEEWRQNEFVVSTDPAHVDLNLVHAVLTNSYWAKGIPRETVARSIENSLCFGIYNAQGQVGFARVITDFATYAHIADVFVLETYRGRGLSKFLMRLITSHPALPGLRRWTLATRDAHGLYSQFGFTPLKAPYRWMERHSPDVYNVVKD
jgi:GNAT superfamily N-acetyltransferase